MERKIFYKMTIHTPPLKDIAQVPLSVLSVYGAVMFCYQNIYIYIHTYILKRRERITEKGNSSLHNCGCGPL